MKNKLKKAYKDYIALLEKACGNADVFMAVHGQGATEEDISEGVRLRGLITKYENE